MKPWLLVAGDFTPLGGMDVANHALARYLAARGEVHLVTHRAWPDLSRLPTVTVHRVRRPFGSHLLGSPWLSREGRRVWRRVGAAPRPRDRQRRQLRRRRGQLGALPPRRVRTDDALDRPCAG